MASDNESRHAVDKFCVAQPAIVTRGENEIDENGRVLPCELERGEQAAMGLFARKTALAYGTSDASGEGTQNRKGRRELTRSFLTRAVSTTIFRCRTNPRCLLEHACIFR